MPFQILPAETRFYDWFEKAAENLVEAAGLLRETIQALARGEDLKMRVERLTEAEHRGDFIVPPVFAQSMYDRNVKGRGVGGKITVAE